MKIRSESVVSKSPEKTRIFDELEKDPPTVYLTPDLALENFLEIPKFKKRQDQSRSSKISAKIAQNYDSKRVQSDKGLKMIMAAREKKAKNELTLKKKAIKSVVPELIAKPNSFGIQVPSQSSSSSPLPQSSSSTKPYIYKPRRNSTVKEDDLEYASSNGENESKDSKDLIHSIESIYSDSHISIASNELYRENNAKRKNLKISKEKDIKKIKKVKEKEYLDINTDKRSQEKMEIKKELPLKNPVATAIHDSQKTYEISYADAEYIEVTLKTVNIVTRDLPSELYLDAHQDSVPLKLLYENSKLIKKPNSTKKGELSQGQKNYKDYRMKSVTTEKEEIDGYQESIYSYSDLSFSDSNEDKSNYEDDNFEEANEGNISRQKREIANMAAEKVVWGLFKTAALANLEDEAQKSLIPNELIKSSVIKNDESIKMKKEKNGVSTIQKSSTVHIQKTHNSVERKIHVLDFIQETKAETKPSFFHKHMKKMNKMKKVLLVLRFINLTKMSIQYSERKNAAFYHQKSKSTNSNYKCILFEARDTEDSLEKESKLEPEQEMMMKENIAHSHESSFELQDKETGPFKNDWKDDNTSIQANLVIQGVEGSTSSIAPTSISITQSRISLKSLTKKTPHNSVGIPIPEERLEHKYTKEKKIIEELKGDKLSIQSNLAIRGFEGSTSSIAPKNISITQSRVSLKIFSHNSPGISIQEEHFEHKDTKEKKIIEEIKDDSTSVQSKLATGRHEGSIGSVASKRRKSIMQSRISLKPLPEKTPPNSNYEKFYINEEAEVLKNSSWVPDFKVFLI